MINEARTLLINDVPNYARGYGTSTAPYRVLEKYGDEYVDPTYTPISEHQHAINAKKFLFGIDPDPLTYNYRVTQYIELLKADPVAAPYLEALDRRRAVHKDVWFNYDFGSSWLQLEDAAHEILVNGFFEGFDTYGHNTLTYEITLLTDDEGVSAIRVKSYRHLIYDRVFVQSGNDPNYFLLPEALRVSVFFTMLGSMGHWIEVHDAENHWTTHWFEAATFVGQPKWLVEVTARPSRTLPEIELALRENGAKGWTFGLPDEEPYRTFAKMATRGHTVQRRLAGTILQTLYSNKLVLDRA